MSENVKLNKRIVAVIIAYALVLSGAGVLPFLGDIFTVNVSADQYGDFYYTDNGTSIAITGYEFGSYNVVVPEMINGKPVTRIENTAFAGMYIISLEIPQSVTDLGEGYLDNCISLTTLTSYSNASTDNNDYVSCDNLKHLRVLKGSAFDNILSPETKEYLGAVFIHNGIEYTVLAGESLSARIPNPNRANQRFLGWYLDSAMETSPLPATLTPDALSMVCNDNAPAVIYAKWEEDTGNNNADNNNTDVTDMTTVTTPRFTENTTVTSYVNYPAAPIYTPIVTETNVDSEGTTTSTRTHVDGSKTITLTKTTEDGSMLSVATTETKTENGKPIAVEITTETGTDGGTIQTLTLTVGGRTIETSSETAVAAIAVGKVKEVIVEGNAVAVVTKDNTVVAASNSSGSLNSTATVKAIEYAVNEDETATSVTVKTGKDVTAISKASLEKIQAIAADSGKEITVNADVTDETGAVVSRITLKVNADTKLANIKTGIDTNANKEIESKFEKAFGLNSDQISSFTTEHKGSFGGKVTIAIKASELGLSGLKAGDKLSVAVYDESSGTYVTTTGVVDKNGYLQAKLDKGGTVLVSTKTNAFKKR